MKHSTVGAPRWLGKVLALLLFVCCMQAFGQGKSGTFDHVKTGFPLTGMHSNTRCESCHMGGVFKGTPRDCAACHTQGARLAQSNTVKPSTHFSTQRSCDSCHTPLGFSGARFDHMGVGNNCSSCHNGVTTSGKPSGHIPTQAACSTCHKTSAWTPATGMDHSAFTSATNCSSCHNGTSATGKSSSHIPTSLNCTSCHTTAGWTPSKWNHSQQTVANQCATCHTGSFPPADGPVSNHIPYKSLSGVSIANCDSCHKAGYATWVGGAFHKNVSVSSQCSTCHLSSSYGLTSRPTTAIHSGQTVCENCHKSTASWAGSKPDHSLFTSATNCSSCHNGTAATGKTSNHIPTTLNCLSCHSTSAWTPSKWNHSQQVVANQCSTCHNGAYPPADGKTSNHIPYTSLTGVVITNCDSCHKAGYSSWNPGVFHTNVSIATQCATCHLSSTYGLTSKPSTTTHSGVTGNCESCHRSTSSWASVVYAHSPANAVGTGTCDNCHNGSTSAVSKPANHIPIPGGTAKCDACHRSQSSFASSITMNHSAVSTATCKSCHNGSYLSAGTLGALAKPGNHIPEAQLLNGTSMDCNACHTTTTSWSNMRMNHNSSQGNGAGWCKACHQSGTNYLGSMEKKSLSHEQSGKTDCSTSGCHKPLGNRGSTYSSW